MRTVLEGRMPALQVVHTADGDWLVADGENDPNDPEGCEAAHLWHVLERDPSLDELASLPPGFVADRDRRGEPWVVSAFEWGEERDPST